MFCGFWVVIYVVGGIVIYWLILLGNVDLESCVYGVVFLLLFMFYWFLRV